MPTQYNPSDASTTSKGVFSSSHRFSISSSRADTIFASVARDVGIASAIHLAWRRGWTISPRIIHLFDAQIKQLADQVDSRSDLLSLLPTLACHASFSRCPNSNDPGRHAVRGYVYLRGSILEDSATPNEQ